MAHPEWNTQEFYDHHFPNAKARTHDVYRVYLNTFNPETDNVVYWIKNSKSLGAKKTKLMLAKQLKDYIPDYNSLSQLIDMSTKNVTRQIKSGVNATQQDDIDRLQRYIDLQKTFFDYEKFPISGWTLFGKYLPPRRREIIGFRSVDKRIDGINCYEKSTDTFVFCNFKSKMKCDYRDPDEIQEYRLSELSFIDPMDRDNIREYLLHNDPVVPSFSKNHFTTRYKEVNGGNINDHRHSWANYGYQKLSRLKYIALCYWMDHNVSTSLVQYCS